MSTDGQTIKKVIPFNEKYGKYNPVYHNHNLHLSDMNTMTVFINDEPGANGREDLYVVTPSLDIWLINTDHEDDYPIEVIANVPPDISHLKPLHGACIIKYDEEHHRLFWLIKGRQIDPLAYNCTGDFHHVEVYFAIYDVDNDGDITEYYVFNEVTKSGDQEHYRDINISDFEFNKDDNGGQSDYLFLAKFNKIETWDINDMDNGPIQTYEVQSGIYGNLPGPDGDPAYYKFSKLLHIDESGLHKIVALPYRYWGNSLADPENYPPLVYVIDCYDINAPATTIVSRLKARKLLNPPRWSTCLPIRFIRPGALTMQTFWSKLNLFPYKLE